MAKKINMKKKSTNNKRQDWLLTTYGVADKVIDAIVFKDRTEQEAEKESLNYTNAKGVKDNSIVKMSDEIKRFSEEWGQSDKEAASALGFDEKDGGFSELMINNDYVWCFQKKVWVAENSRLYDKRDDAVIEYIKNNQF